MVQKLGLGTAAIGRPQYINVREGTSVPFELNTFKKDGVSFLEEAYQHGIRYFDTAPGYGIAEQLLIDWLKNKNDSSIEVATKWGYEYVANFDPNATLHERKEHSVYLLNKQWEKSKALFPFLTTLQIHSATFETGVLENKEVLNRLRTLKDEFGTKIGLTTTGDNQLEVLDKALENPLFEVFQVTYNVFDQSLFTVLKDHKVDEKRIIIKEALANGRVFPNENYSHYTEQYTLLEELAKRYKVGIDAIALQFCHQTLNPFKVLSGVIDSAHLKSNLRTNDITLTDQEIVSIQALKIDPKLYWGERKQLGWN